MEQPGRLGKEGSGNGVDMPEEKLQNSEAINRRAHPGGFGGMIIDLCRQEDIVLQLGDNGTSWVEKKILVMKWNIPVIK